MSKIELPPLPEHAAAWVIPGDDGGSLGKWVDAKPFSEDEFTAPLFTAAQLRARDRQIVELCASFIEARSLRVRRIRAAMNSEDVRPCEDAAAIRALLDEKKENE